MALGDFTFATPQAYSGGADFSPLARLGALGQPRALADIGQNYQPNADSYGANSYNRPDTMGIGPTPSIRGTPLYSTDQKQVAQQVTKELRDQGFSDNAISGILYNIGQESNFNPNLRHADQPRFGGEAHYAHGLFQEGGDEWNTMAAHLQSRGTNWTDPVEQARFVAGRLKGDIGNAQYGSVMRALQAASTPEEAAKIFARGYLKPANQYLMSRMTDINRGIPSLDFYTGQ